MPRANGLLCKLTVKTTIRLRQQKGLEELHTMRALYSNNRGEIYIKEVPEAHAAGVGRGDSDAGLGLWGRFRDGGRR